jgi:hypothetical protein
MEGIIRRIPEPIWRSFPQNVPETAEFVRLFT